MSGYYSYSCYSKFSSFIWLDFTFHSKLFSRLNTFRMMLNIFFACCLIAISRCFLEITRYSAGDVEQYSDDEAGYGRRAGGGRGGDRAGVGRGRRGFSRYAYANIFGRHVKIILIHNQGSGNQSYFRGPL